MDGSKSDHHDIAANRPPPPPPPRRPGVKRISLALQGGGAHGAFTWGVMDRLMSDQRLYIDGISGTSAGAINGVVFADGFIKGQRQGAIDALAALWRLVSERALIAGHGPGTLLPDLPWAGAWQGDSAPLYVMLDFITRLYSPYQLNPLNLNPLRDILEELVDFAGLRAHPSIKLFVTASNVRTCKPRVFRTAELTVEMLLASACLPLLFQAVEVAGEHYWDGGYLGNPAIYPLIHECASNDVVIVQINPMQRHDVPRTAREILNRINEMSFNSSLVREMRGIATVSRLVEQGRLSGTGYDAVRFHQIEAESDLAKLGALSKFNTEWRFLQNLHELGYGTADRWLDAHYDAIGTTETLDVFETFL